VIGTVPVDAAGAYQLDIRNSTVAASTRVSIESARGGVLRKQAVREIPQPEQNEGSRRGAVARPAAGVSRACSGRQVRRAARRQMSSVGVP
jgi:hypothetical protein